MKGNEENAIHTCGGPGEDGEHKGESTVAAAAAAAPATISTAATEGYNPYALRNEAFAPVLAVMEIDCEDAEGASLAECFLSKVPSILYEELFGTLSCSVIAPPSFNSARETDKLGAVFSRFLAELKYGMGESEPCY